ncbi:NACHT domain-containing protein [Streptomyces microflavus]|uniref:NACHT domain-containing protein n=1 Tax=Streptomyces microflavus TaxID=1919 RepID=UPI0033B6BFCD
MVGWEQLAYKVAAGALRSAASVAMQSALAPKTGALIVQDGSTGRFRNKFLPTVEISEKDIKAFTKHVRGVVEPLLEHEYADLDAPEINSALEAASKSFAATTADVFEADFDPRVYGQKVVDESRAEVARLSLSDSGYNFYSTVVQEVSAQILNFITTWPSFLARSNVEQLKRLTAAAKELQSVRRAVIDDASTEEVRFEEKYSEVVVKRLDQLELFGVTLSQPEQRPYPLSTAYISLSVSEAGGVNTKNFEKNFMNLEVPVGEKWPDAAVVPVSGEVGGGLRSESAISSYDRILLRGDAGSGKTTLLHWLSVNSARRSFDGELRSFNGYVPFLLPLRRFADRELPAAHEFLNEVGKHIVGEMPSGWVNRVLRSGRAFVLVDGVDELPESRRQEAKEWLEGLLDTYPLARYIVTSRPAAAEEKWLSQDKFISVDLLPMGGLDIANFVHHWHDAARSCLTADTSDEEAEELAKYESELVDAIRSQRQLRKLASNPLLCALLCTLSRDRRMQLPQGRMELYAAALEMLLVRRDIERRITHTGAPNLTLKQKQQILGHFSYWLLRNQLTDTTNEYALNQVSLALESMPTVGSSAPDVFKYLMVRSGVLRQPIEGRVDFIHRTFQEYLAAATIVSLNDIGALVKNAHLDQWHEVVAMAVGHARPEECSSILNRLINRGNEEPDNTARLHLLAAACLENADQVDRKTYDLVRHHAAQLIPPSKVSEAKELAAVGESVLPLLPRSGRRLLALQAASTVRTASLVGGETALDILAGYGADNRKAVYSELSRAWTQFDVSEYAERVMSKSPLASKELIIDHEQLIPTLKYFPNLESLQFRCSVDSVDWVDSCPSLVKLAVWDPSVALLEAVSTLPALKSLALGFFAESEVRHFETLSALVQLGALTLHVNRRDRLDFSDFPEMAGLRRLQIGSAGSVLGFARKEQFPNLESALFTFCEEVDFSQLKNVRSLLLVQMLHVKTFLNVQELSGLSNLKVRAWGVSTEQLDQFAKIEGVDSVRIHMVPGASGVVDLSAFAGKSDVRISFYGKVEFSSPVASLGDGVQVITSNA